jgi:hypothetical protein
MFTFFHMLDLVLVIASFVLALTIQLLSAVSIELEQVRECTCAWNTLYMAVCSPLYQWSTSRYRSAGANLV